MPFGGFLLDKLLTHIFQILLCLLYHLLELVCGLFLFSSHIEKLLVIGHRLLFVFEQIGSTTDWPNT